MVKCISLKDEDIHLKQARMSVAWEMYLEVQIYLLAYRAMHKRVVLTATEGFCWNGAH